MIGRTKNKLSRVKYQHCVVKVLRIKGELSDISVVANCIKIYEVNTGDIALSKSSTDIHIIYQFVHY